MSDAPEEGVDALSYLDNAAATYPKPEPVYQALERVYRADAADPAARQRVITRVRDKLGGWLGLTEAAQDRVLLTPSASVALNQVLLGSGLSATDTVYVTPFEHNAVLRALEHLRVTTGMRVRTMPWLRDSAQVDTDALARALDEGPPTLVAVTQASNVFGLLPQVEEIARLARRANPSCIVVVDGAQSAGLYPLDLGANLVDYYVFCGYKTLYAPWGIAGMVMASNRRPSPVLFGETGVASERPEMPASGPARYEVGSSNVLAAAGLEAALDWLGTTGRQVVRGSAEERAAELRTRLSAFPAVKVQAPLAGDAVAPIVSFSVRGMSVVDVEAAMRRDGVVVRGGVHGAPAAHRWLGTLDQGGTVRASTSCFTKAEDVERLCRAVEKLVRSI